MSDLTPTMKRVLDVIATSGPDGITGHELAEKAGTTYGSALVYVHRLRKAGHRVTSTRLENPNAPRAGQREAYWLKAEGQ